MADRVDMALEGPFVFLIILVVFTSLPVIMYF